MCSSENVQVYKMLDIVYLISNLLLLKVGGKKICHVSLRLFLRVFTPFSVLGLILLWSFRKSTEVLDHKHWLEF